MQVYIQIYVCVLILLYIYLQYLCMTSFFIHLASFLGSSINVNS